MSLGEGTWKCFEVYDSPLNSLCGINVKYVMCKFVSWLPWSSNILMLNSVWSYTTLQCFLCAFLHYTIYYMCLYFVQVVVFIVFGPKNGIKIMAFLKCAGIFWTETLKFCLQFACHIVSRYPFFHLSAQTSLCEMFIKFPVFLFLWDIPSKMCILLCKEWTPTYMRWIFPRVRDTEELTKHDKACSITGHVIDSCYLKQYYYFFSIFCK